MKQIYKNTIKHIGIEADAFKEEKMIILFGDNAPDTLKDFCHCIEINPILATINIGQKIIFDNNEYNITAVGNAVEKNLSELGHITIVFNGAKEAELPGSLYVENKEIPVLKIGSEITIKAS